MLEICRWSMGRWSRWHNSRQDANVKSRQLRRFPSWYGMLDLQGMHTLSAELRAKAFIIRSREYRALYNARCSNLPGRPLPKLPRSNLLLEHDVQFEWPSVLHLWDKEPEPSKSRKSNGHPHEPNPTAEIPSIRIVDIGSAEAEHKIRSTCKSPHDALGFCTKAERRYFAVDDERRRPNTKGGRDDDKIGKHANSPGFCQRSFSWGRARVDLPCARCSLKIPSNAYSKPPTRDDRQCDEGEPSPSGPGGQPHVRAQREDA